MPNAGPKVGDEIKEESWRESRHIQDWIHAGNADWGVTLSTDHQFVRLGDGVIRAEMLRGVRFTSVKVASGDRMGSMNYPPPGTYKFRYSLVSHPGTLKQALVWRQGLDFNNPLLPVEVADDISHKSLAPTRSLLSLDGDNLVLSAVKKSETDPAVVVRAYEIAGASGGTRIDFLGQARSFREVNVLEEEPGAPAQVLKFKPYEIRTVKLQ
jgi:alpha-mannosidase